MDCTTRGTVYQEQIPPLLTAKEAAKYLRIGKNKLAEIVKTGHLSHIAIGPKTKRFTHSLTTTSNAAPLQPGRFMGGLQAVVKRTRHHKELPQMSTLYELADEYSMLQALLMSEEGDAGEAVAQHWATTVDNFHAKALAYVQILRNIESNVDAIDGEVKRLQALKASRGRAVNSLKDRLKLALETTDNPKLDLGLFELSIRACPPSVEIDSLDHLPDAFIRIKREPDKTTIKNYWIAQGKCPEGAHVVTDKTRLHIR